MSCDLESLADVGTSGTRPLRVGWSVPGAHGAVSCTAVLPEPLGTSLRRGKVSLDLSVI